MADNSDKKKWDSRIQKLKNKYRLVVLNDETFEEKFSVKLSRLNVYAIISSFILIIGLIIFSLLAFTSLKEYLPGYSTDIYLRKDLIVLNNKSDSLQNVITQQENFIASIKNVLNDKDGGLVESSEMLDQRNFDSIKLEQKTEEEQELVQQFEEKELYKLPESETERNSISDLYFCNPVEGLIVSKFEPLEEHFGIDIVCKEGSAVKAVYDGLVVMSEPTVETGHTIVILHDHNLLSFYKHNSTLLKKCGNFVKAGDAIAIVGNSGKFTSGPHLHFELWQNSNAQNPEEYLHY